MINCHVDIESFSKCNLPKSGLYRYAEDPSTEVLVLCYAFGDEPVSTWVPHDKLPTELIASMHAYHEKHGGEFIMSARQAPFEIVCHAQEGGEFRAHNSEFERVMLNGQPGMSICFPPTTIEQWVCTAAKAAASGLPRKLEKVCIAINSPHKKSKTGTQVMHQVTKPRKPSKAVPEERWTPRNSPQRFSELYRYCVDDVLAERSIDDMIPELTKRERQVFLMDQRINERGVRVDLRANGNAAYLRDQYKAVLRSKCKKISGYTPSQTGKLGAWIRERYAMPNLQEATMKKALADPDIPKDVKDVVTCRRFHELKSVAKFDSIIRAVCHDDRLRGMFLYHGAGTGRWVSLIVQLHNLMRPLISDPYVAVEALEARDLKWLNTLYEKNPMVVLGSIVRSIIVAAPGHDLLCLDYSSIEGRVTAWLAGELTKLQIFRTHGKIYEYSGAVMHNLPTDLDFLMTMKQNYPDERFTGKTAELALGFQGGAKALQKQALKDGIELDDMRAEQIKYDWRDTNPAIVNMWYALQEHCAAAIAHPGQLFKTNKLYFKVIGDWLYMRLPSGRKLAYYKPEINAQGEPTYLGIDTYTRQWGRVVTYGGRLTENAASGTARDVLVHGMNNLEREEYPLIGTVHDEIIMEPEEGFGSLEQARELMCDMPDWADGLPVTADGFRAKRYRKD